MNYVTYQAEGIPISQFGTGSPPVGSNYISISAAQLATVEANPGAWCVIGSALSNYSAPAAEQLAAAQKSQIKMISAGCATTIVSGFTSSALGAAYAYPSKEGGENHDQINLIGAYGNSLNPANASTWTTKFWCCDASGSWAFRAHTAAQIQQVFSDGAARKIACIEQNAALSAQVMAAADVASVQAIVWVAP